MKKLFFFLTALLVIGLAHGEVTLLFDDFDNDANNWTFVNGALTNKWVIATNATDNATHSIYVSNSPEGTENPAHATSATSNRNNIFFYQDITFPENAINITLSFDFFTGLEVYGLNYMRVYLPETSYMPEATIGDIPEIPNQIGRYSYNSASPSYYSGGFWANLSIDIPTELATGQTRRLVFLWTSRSSGSASDNCEPAALDNIKITYTENQLFPAKVINLEPLNNAENLTVSQRLYWHLEGSTPTGYYIYIDTNNPPTTMYDVVGDFTNYRPEPALEWGKKYYWRVVPYNEHGYTENDTVWSFSTRQDPTITSYPYLENFDDLPYNSAAFPVGWGKVANPTFWDHLPMIEWSLNASYSVPNFIWFHGHNFSPSEYTTIISTPPIQNITEKRLKFFASASLDGIPLRVGTMQWQDDTESFVAIETIYLTTEYKQYMFNLSDAVGDYVAFSNLFDATIANPTFVKRIDDILIEDIPNGPDFYISNTNVEFEGFYLHETRQTTITFANLGNEVLNIQQVLPAVITSDAQDTLDILPNESIDVVYTFAPVNPYHNFHDIVLYSNAENAPTVTITIRAYVSESPPDYPDDIEMIVDGIVQTSDRPWYAGTQQYSYTQTIYYPYEINRQEGELITSVFYRYTNTITAISDIVIYMGYTTLNSFNDELEWISIDNLTHVFNGQVTLEANSTLGITRSSWIEIKLDEHFFYNPNYNLVIAVNKLSGDNFGSNRFYSLTDNYHMAMRTLVTYNDTKPIDLNSPPSAGVTSNYLNVPSTMLRFASDHLPPNNLIARQMQRTVVLSWQQPLTEPINYSIYRDGVLLTTTSELIFIDEDVVNDKYYTYGVTSNFQSGESEPAEITIYVLYFAPPNNLSAEFKVDNVTLQWEEPDSIASETRIAFVVYRDDQPLAPIVRSDGFNFYDFHFEYNVEYTYYVKAIYECETEQESPPSNSVVIYIDDSTDNYDGTVIPTKTELHRNFPNPFNPETTIQFSVINSGNVSIQIYNLRGQKIRTLLENNMDVGVHSVVWDGTDDSGRTVGSGVYFYQMQTTDFTDTKRMLLLK